MAIFHLSARPPIARSAGRSSVAAAAYRAGVRLVDERTGEVHDFSRRRGVLSAHLLLPGGAEAPDRGAFWNAVEAHHKRSDAVVAREVIVALPHELNEAQRQELALALARHITERYGVAADVALHAPDPKGAELNWHAHIQQSACKVAPDGTLGKKAELLDPIHCKRHKIEDNVTWLRPLWERLVNEALAAAGRPERVDHRSHAAAGIQDEPTIKEGHGPDAGRRRARNDAIRDRNAERAQIDAQMQELLRERAQLAAREKIAEASRAAAEAARRMAAEQQERREREDRRQAAELESLREQQAAAKREQAEALQRLEAIARKAPRALPAAEVKKAKEAAPKLARRQQQQAELLEALRDEARRVPWFRLILRRRYAAAIATQAGRVDRATKAAEAAQRTAGAPVRESLDAEHDRINERRDELRAEIARRDKEIRRHEELQLRSPQQPEAAPSRKIRTHGPSPP